jgi:hypothetical protein
MARHPLTPQGGEAEKVYAKVPRGEVARIDQAARRRGMTRSQFIRLVLSQATHGEEVTASAS